MKKILLITLSLFFLLSGCSQFISKTDSPVQTAQKLTQPRLSEPKPLLPEKIDYEDKSYQLAAEKSNAFGLAVSEKLLTDGENLLYSPYSAYLALSCISGAASGEAKEQLNKALTPEGMTDEEFHRANAVLLGLLLDDYTKPIEIATLICTDDDFIPQKAFAQNALDNYRGETASMDFQSPGTKDAINDWANKKTKGLIPRVMDSDPDPATILVLANSLYYSGRWNWEFDPDKTETQPFKGTSGETDVPFMTHTGEQSYFEDEAVQAIRLSFQGSSAMTVILPREGVPVQKVIEMLADGSMEPEFSSHKGTLKLPRFKTEASHGLNEVLKELGLTVMFDPSVNSFSGLVEEELAVPIYISKVCQKSFIEVDEKGTTAAAVTVIEAPAGAMPPEVEPPPFEMIVDRPFVFLLTQRARGGEVILFVGVINCISG